MVAVLIGATSEHEVLKWFPQCNATHGTILQHSPLGAASPWWRIRLAHIGIPWPGKYAAIRWNCEHELTNSLQPPASDSGLSRHHTPEILSLQHPSGSDNHLWLAFLRCSHCQLAWRVRAYLSKLNDSSLTSLQEKDASRFLFPSLQERMLWSWA